MTAQLSPEERRKLFEACIENPERFDAALDAGQFSMVAISLAAFGRTMSVESVAKIRAFIATLDPPPKPLTDPCNDPACDARCTDAHERGDLFDRVDDAGRVIYRARIVAITPAGYELSSPRPGTDVVGSTRWSAQELRDLFRKVQK